MDYLEMALSINKTNRQQITEDSFFDWLFSQGAKQADIWFNQILPVAQSAGYKVIFKEQYIKRRAVVIKKEFSLNNYQPIGNTVPALADYKECLLPPSYKIDELHGILKFDPNTLEYNTVFPHIVIISRRYQNINTKEHYVKVCFFDNGAVNEFVVNLYTISSSQAIQGLTKNGVRVTSETAKFLVNFLSDFINANIVQIPILKITSTLGWEGKDFLPYSDNVEFDGNDYTKSILEAVKCVGDYGLWKKEVAESCKNDYVRACMATSFASPLISATQKPIFITHLWGKSGTAKTVALLLALSAWGDPKRLMCQWNATVVASEQKAIILNNIPMSMNESELLHGSKGAYQSHSDFIYMYCEGESKPRGAKDGGLQIGGRWSNCCISNGEGSLINEKSKEGELNRVLEFQTDEKLFNTEERAIYIAGLAKNNYGHAGKQFTEACLNYDLRAIWDRFFEITKEHGTGKQAGAMSSLLLGDMLMQAIIYGVSEESAFENTLKFFDRIKENMKTSESIDISVRAKAFIDGWVAQNVNCFVNNYAGKEPTLTYGIVKDGMAYIINSVFTEILTKQGFNLNKTLKDFKDRGYFGKAGTEKTTIPTRINGILARCYVFDLKTELPEELY